MLYRHSLRYTGLMVAIIAMGACGDDGAGPEGSGQMSVAITDDPAATAQQLMRRQGTLFVVNGQTAAAQFTGSISGEASVEISTDGVAWVSLGSPQQFTLAAQSSGETTTVHTSVDVPVDVYARARLTMEDAVASISAGSSIGGVVLNTDAELMLGGTDQSVTIEVPLSSVSVTAEATTMLFFDLNAESWVTSSALQAGMVADADLSAAVTAAAQVQN